MRNLTLGETSWPLTPWNPAKQAAAAIFVQHRYFATKRPEEEAYARVKDLPEKIIEPAFLRCVERLDGRFPSEEQASAIFVQPETVRYLASLVCPSCPPSAITAENSIEAYCQLVPTPPTAAEKAALYASMFDVVAKAARGEVACG